MRAAVQGSLDELAQWMAVDPKDLKATVDEYNTFCDKGHDEAFVKDPEWLSPLRTPPYYVIKCTARFLNPTGGIKISPKALNIDRKVRGSLRAIN